VEIHPKLDYSIIEKSELLLAHTVCHNLFALQKNKKEFLGSAHAKIVDEFEKRGLEHKYFDKLDNIR